MNDQILVGLSFIVTGVYLVLFWRNPAMALHGTQSAWLMFTKALPWMTVSMLIAGLLERSIDRHLLYRLFGAHSGFRGVFLATILGSLGTGSRWGVYPLAAAMLAARASLPSVMAFTTSWMLISIPRSASEFPFFGIRLTFVRMALSFAISILAGLIMLLFTRT